jgi:hypothetical protein
MTQSWCGSIPDDETGDPTAHAVPGASTPGSRGQAAPQKGNSIEQEGESELDEELSTE